MMDEYERGRGSMYLANAACRDAHPPPPSTWIELLKAFSLSFLVTHPPSWLLASPSSDSRMD